MLAALLKAVLQLGDPRLRRVLWLGAGAAILLFLLAAVAVGLGLSALELVGIPWLDGVLAVVGAVGTLVVAWLLLPAAVAAIAGLFLEDVAAAVEARHYPGLGPGRAQPLGEAVASGARLLGLALLFNLVALPLYLALPGLNLLIFLGVNGWLLGREHFELVALRHLPPAEARELRRRYGLTVWTAGTVIAGLASLPLVNLAAPVVGTAFMTHIVERLRRQANRR